MTALNKTQARWILVATVLIAGAYLLYAVLKWIVVVICALLVAGLLLWWLRASKPG